MAWREVKVEQQRQKFIATYLKKSVSVAELCRQFKISRQNGYKWITPYAEEGLQGLKNRSFSFKTACPSLSRLECIQQPADRR